MVTTTDTSMDTFYGALIGALVVLLGVSVFLLLVSKSKTSNQPQPYGNVYRCSNCGNNLKQTDLFCGQCGAQISKRSL
jgi:rRNA maturation endonuclease Nob1